MPRRRIVKVHCVSRIERHGNLSQNRSRPLVHSDVSDDETGCRCASLEVKVAKLESDVAAMKEFLKRKFPFFNLDDEDDSDSSDTDDVIRSGDAPGGDEGFSSNESQGVLHETVREDTSGEKYRKERPQLEGREDGSTSSTSMTVRVGSISEELEPTPGDFVIPIDVDYAEDITPSMFGNLNDQATSVSDTNTEIRSADASNSKDSQDIPPCGLDDQASSDSDTNTAVRCADASEDLRIPKSVLKGVRKPKSTSATKQKGPLKSNSDRARQCSKCNKTFRYPSSLREHEQTHSALRPFECTVCKKRFLLRSYLTRHSRIHRNERPYKCNVCFMAFHTSWGLKRHERIHTDRRKFKCAVCQKKFSEQRLLRSHKRFHRNDRSHECHFCKMRFARMRELEDHQRTHTGEKPFQCEVCKKAFSQIRTLKEHNRIHTGEQPFECQVCKRRFSQRTNLRRHLTTQHGK